jgi:hypothetical protein
MRLADVLLNRRGMKLARRRFGRLIGVALLALGCASAPRSQPETAARLKDSAPEKITAQRAAVRGLDLEQDDQWWGFEGARERRDQDRKKQDAGKSAAAEGKQPVDVTQMPPPRVTP